MFKLFSAAELPQKKQENISTSQKLKFVDQCYRSDERVKILQLRLRDTSPH